MRDHLSVCVATLIALGMFINEIKCEGVVGLLMTTKQMYVCNVRKLCIHPRTVREGDGTVQVVWRAHADWTIVLGLEVSFTCRP